MTDLHSALLARIHRGDPYGVITVWKALRVVAELHAPTVEPYGVVCSSCRDVGGTLVEVPCDESKVIAAQLGVEIGETPK